jgi:hypothetical protein
VFHPRADVPANGPLIIGTVANLREEKGLDL